MRRLVDGADVFLCNLLPHRQARYGLDPATLLARRPPLVHATLSGYGLTGPEATAARASTSRRSSAAGRSPTR